jgi:ligand-binding sensor domain-containing protein/AraC-like DNA-binding protein
MKRVIKKSFDQTFSKVWPPAEISKPRIPAPWFVLIIACWYLLIGACLNLRGSTVTVDRDRYIVTAWTIEDGLPQNSVLCLLQAADGYIWFGTQSGLVRFDGVGLRVYNRWNTPGLKNDRILCLYEGAEGVLWVGTDGGGLSRLKNGEGESYTVARGLANNTVRAICGGPGNNFWIGVDNGLNHLDLRGGSLKTYSVAEGLSGYPVTALYWDRGHDGLLWIGTSGSGLNWLKDGKFLPVPHKETFWGKEITVFHEDRSGTLWIGTDQGLYGLENEAERIVDPVSSLPGISIKAMVEDQNSATWIGTDGDGLYREKNGVFTSLTTRQGLPEDFIYSLLADREGNLWIGTTTTGLVRLKPAKVKNITTVAGLPENRVHTVLQDDSGYLWIGTRQKGLAQFKSENDSLTFIRTFTTADGLPGNRIRALCLDREKNLWIGTEGGGLAKKQKEKFQVYTTAEGLSSGHVTAIFQDRSGTLWAGTTQGLNRWEQDRFTLYKPNSRLATAHIRTLGEDRQGNLLVGTRQGLFRLAKEGTLQDFGFDYDVPAFYEDAGGNLWIGTNGSGLLRCRQGDPLRCDTFTTRNGLPGNYIFSINEDKSGNLWISSYRGVFRVSKQDLENLAGGKSPGDSFITVVTIDEEEGMNSSECVLAGQPSAWKTSPQDEGEKIYIPTTKGLAILDIETLTPRTGTLPPPVIIEQVIADNQTPDNHLSPAILPPGTQMVEFYFTALNFTAPDKIRIFYRLDGFDGQWQEASPQQKRRAFYLNLSPGNYCFQVIACSSDGTWNRSGARFEFKIYLPLYKRPVFYLTILLGLAVMIGSLFRYLYRQRKTKPGVTEEREPKEKYKTSALLPETVDQVLPQLNRLMEKEKAFLKPDLTLKKLSDQLHVHYNHLSRIINEHLGKSFNDYVNSYRIEEARKQLTDPSADHKTILEIAYDTGFYSKSVFNTAFKKFTGMTPSQYKKKAGSEEK